MLRIFKQYYPIRNIFFIIGEALVIYASVVFAFLIFFSTEPIHFDRLVILKILLITFVCQVCLYYNDLYDLKITDSFTELGIRLLQSLGAASIVLAFIYLVFPMTIIGQGVFFMSVAFFILFIVSWRFCYMIILSHGLFNKKIIILGQGDLAKKIISEIKNKKDCGYTVSVLIQNESGKTDFTDEKRPAAMIYKKDYEGICEVAKELGINKIVVAMVEKRGMLPIRELLNCRVNGIDVIEGTSFYEMLTGKLIVNQINPAWLIFSEGFHKSYTRRFLKRATDLILSFVMLVLLFPLIIITALLIKIDSEGPVIYSQERVGQNKKPYLVYKFRSMVVDAEKESGPVWATEDDDRISRVGKLLRKLRVDEIPQLWNVLKGDMSFVGPRPEREYFVNELEAVVPYYEERFNVKPGITGWAQVCYPYGASVEDATEKLNYDLFYIKNMSIFMDLMIILRTIKIVLFGKGAR